MLLVAAYIATIPVANWLIGNVGTVCDQLFGGNKALLYFLNAAVSEWIGARTGLPIDFQIQRQTDANLEFKGRPRNAVGIWVAHLGDTP